MGGERSSQPKPRAAALLGPSEPLDRRAKLAELVRHHPHTFPFQPHMYRPCARQMGGRHRGPARAIRLREESAVDGVQVPQHLLRKQVREPLEQVEQREKTVLSSSSAAAAAAPPPWPSAAGGASGGERGAASAATEGDTPAMVRACGTRERARALEWGASALSELLGQNRIYFERSAIFVFSGRPSDGGTRAEEGLAGPVAVQ